LGFRDVFRVTNKSLGVQQYDKFIIQAFFVSTKKVQQITKKYVFCKFMAKDGKPALLFIIFAY